MSAHALRLLLHLCLAIRIKRFLELSHANEHVLLGLILRKDSSSLSALNRINKLVWGGNIQTKHTTEDVLTVET